MASRLASVELYRLKKPWMRWDIGPMFVGHAVLHTQAWLALQREGPELRWLMVAMPCLVVAHLLTFLGTRWSVRWKCMVAYERVGSWEKAEWALATPPKNGGKRALCRTQGTQFSFQKRNFVLDAASSCGWSALGSPYCGMTVGEYAQQWRQEQDVDEQRRLFGPNEFEIPDPTFAELFEEHYLAPFFVFQVACCILWSMDEYWLYSAFTLVMIFVFEATLCAQRLRSLEHLRGVRKPPRLIFVYRASRWQLVSSADLVPGDLVSLSTSLSRRRRGATAPTPVPCDVVVVRGSCVVNEAMLTGESTPQTKDALGLDDPTTALDVDGAHRCNVVFGGTEILSATCDEETTMPGGAPPDRGVVAHVVRTGFETSQGQLMRMILYATERVSGSSDSVAFICVLLLFAVVAALHVLNEGLKEVDPPRNRFKLALHCILIVTSVVPPELPMELSLAVTNSLAALNKIAIYCTEPFRVAFAGAVDVCCFDKTGTLTSDELKLSVVVAGQRRAFAGNGFFKDLDADCERVLASCHSLAVLPEDGAVVGDSLERAQFQVLHPTWRFTGKDTVKKAGSTTLRIRKRFPFVAEKRRMSCVVADDDRTCWVVCKGAPEALKPLLADAPADYDEIWRDRAARGERVLALASRRIGGRTAVQLQRNDAEQDLQLCGFVAFASPLKPGTRAVVSHLLASSHRCIVITGDGVLTAAHVARQVGILTNKEPNVLVASQRRACWRPLSRELDDDYDDGDESLFAAAIVPSADLVVRGDGLAALTHDSDIAACCDQALVFARVAPDQKEQIVAALNARGHTTLMCGDGTNDVGALKRAHVGVSIMNSPLLEARLERALAERSPGNGDLLTWLAGLEVDALDLDPTLVNLGDASIASPFTSKRATIDCVVAIICQGRCTLVTMIEVFQILGVFCLQSAYMMSTSTIHGIKQGDTQMAVVGLSNAVFFFVLSRAQPLPKLSERRPPVRVFDATPSLSIICQFGVHFASLLLALRLCDPFKPQLDPAHVPDGAFAPNVVNSTMFLLSALVQLNTFAANYRGYPFMESLRHHKQLACVLSVCVFYSLQGSTRRRLSAGRSSRLGRTFLSILV